jgi:hypothetical protein
VGIYLDVKKLVDIHGGHFDGGCTWIEVEDRLEKVIFWEFIFMHITLASTIGFRFLQWTCSQRTALTTREFPDLC